MPRPTCIDCGFIMKDCVCDAITEVTNKVNIIVLQHNSETHNAKNTVRLASLIYSNITVIAGSKRDDFNVLETLPTSTTGLLYPNHDARPIEQNLKTQISHLIVLDGTWKKANKLLFTLPILKTFQSFSFDSLPANHYHLRKANRSDSLSSLEAVALSLHHLEQLPMEPAYTALKKMMDNQFNHMSEAVRARYKSG